MNVSNESVYIVHLPWWTLVVAWLAAVNGALVWEAVKKAGETRDRQRRANSARLARPVQYLPAPGATSPPGYPDTRRGGETAGTSPRPQNTSFDWKVWLGVVANVVGIVGGIVGLFLR